MATKDAAESISVYSTIPRRNVVFDNYEYSFAEILPPATGRCPRMVEALYINVEPKQCSSILKELSDLLPLEEDLAHLKRVRKHRFHGNSENAEQSEGPIKRPKLLLQVLVGSQKQQNQLNIVDNTSSTNLSRLRIHRFFEQHGPLYEVTVPGRPPRSHAEWKEWNNTVWPTQFLPLRTEEYQHQKGVPSLEEFSRMRELIEESISKSIIIIVDPSNDLLLSTCRSEQKLQQDQLFRQASSQRISLHNNPLATPILLAIQGVSRRERLATQNHAFGTVNGTEETSNSASEVPSTKMLQYLCTGYDMYCYYEPTIFEAMACLHSRLRRLIYFSPNPYPSCVVADERKQFLSRRVFPNAFSKHYIHNLPGTNHHYRAFEYHRSDAVKTATGTSCESTAGVDRTS